MGYINRLLKSILLSLLARVRHEIEEKQTMSIAAEQVVIDEFQLRECGMVELGLPEGHFEDQSEYSRRGPGHPGA
jgi:hypothetical protein